MDSFLILGDKEEIIVRTYIDANFVVRGYIDAIFQTELGFVFLSEW